MNRKNRTLHILPSKGWFLDSSQNFLSEKSYLDLPRSTFCSKTPIMMKIRALFAPHQVRTLGIVVLKILPNDGATFLIFKKVSFAFLTSSFKLFFAARLLILPSKIILILMTSQIRATHENSDDPNWNGYNFCLRNFHVVVRKVKDIHRNQFRCPKKVIIK